MKLNHEGEDCRVTSVSPTQCPRCGERDASQDHLKQCAWMANELARAVVAGDAYSVPEVTVVDLWSHLYMRLDPISATRVVSVVLDLGWRPVVGSDPKRLWVRAPSAATPPLPSSEPVPTVVDVATQGALL